MTFSFIYLGKIIFGALTQTEVDFLDGHQTREVLLVQFQLLQLGSGQDLLAAPGIDVL